MTAVTHNASPGAPSGDACDASSAVARFARAREARFHKTRHRSLTRVTGDAFSQVQLYAQARKATMQTCGHHASPAGPR